MKASPAYLCKDGCGEFLAGGWGHGRGGWTRVQEENPLSLASCFCSSPPATVSSRLCLASSMERKNLRRYPASPTLEVSSVHLQIPQSQERILKSLT